LKIGDLIEAYKIMTGKEDVESSLFTIATRTPTTVIQTAM